MTRDEMLTGRERSEVREEIREGDRTTMREERRIEEPRSEIRDRDVVRDREGNIVRDRDGNIVRDRDVAQDRDRENLIWSGALKHREAIHISGPSVIRFTYDVGGVHGEKEAACNNGPIYVP
jgi:hypothetical protein